MSHGPTKDTRQSPFSIGGNLCIVTVGTVEYCLFCAHRSSKFTIKLFRHDQLNAGLTSDLAMHHDLTEIY